MELYNLLDLIQRNGLLIIAISLFLYSAVTDNEKIIVSALPKLFVISFAISLVFSVTTGKVIFSAAVVVYTFATLGLLIFVYSAWLIRRNVFAITVFSFCILSSIHQYADYELMKMAEQEEHREFVRNFWYMFFAFTYFIYVLVVYVITEKIKLKATLTTSFIITSTITLGFIQLIRYADRILINTDILGKFYEISVPAINLAIVLVIACHSIFTIVKTLKSKDFLEGDL